MNILLYEMLTDIECDDDGKPTLEVIDSAREIADQDMQKDLDEIEVEITKED